MIGSYPRKSVFKNADTIEAIKHDKRYISPSYTRDYPFVVKKGRGREVQCLNGNWFLDFGAGIAVTATGHCHPAVVRAIQDQAADLIHMSGTDFYYEAQAQLAEKLADTCSGFDKGMVFFGNSGAEAVEAAMKLARFTTRRPGFIAFTGAFHGRTLGSVSLTGSKAIQSKGYLPLQPVAHVPYPNCDNCWFSSPDDGLEGYCRRNGAKCVDYIQYEIIDRGIMPAEDCAAIVMEPIQGEGGYIVPPDFWYQDINAIAKQNDILIICDEVQAGMGRTGKWFAHQNFKSVLDSNNVFTPDIITFAKGVASGMPLGGIIAETNLMGQWEYGSHASTFGGNPVACAAALATIEVIERDGLMENARKMGDHLHKELQALELRNPMFNDPRGMGLMRAIDIDGHIAGAPARDHVVMKAFEKGLILLGCGKQGIRFCPALNVTKEEIDTCVSILEEAGEEVF